MTGTTRRRVVVTGIGVITPIGKDVESMWKVLREGGSGIGRITHFDARNFPTKIAAEVKNFEIANYVEDPIRFSASGRNILFAIGAATEAVRASGIQDASLDPSRFGVYLGAGEGERSALYAFPFLVLPAALRLKRHCAAEDSLAPLGVTLGFLALQCWLTETVFYTYW